MTEEFVTVYTLHSLEEANLWQDGSKLKVSNRVSRMFSQRKMHSIILKSWSKHPM